MRAKREELSRLISWGHWFTFINVIFCVIIGSQYIVQSDWPVTLAGRLYAIFSCIGQFGFLCILGYLFSLFWLTFIIRSFFVLRIIAVVLSTLGIAVLLLDLIAYQHFRLHLNTVVVNVFSSQTGRALLPDLWVQCLAIIVIFGIEWGVATLLWNKQRKLHKIKPFAKGLSLFAVVTFFLSHLMYMWADANFYRSITMQRTTLPLSYPLTARHLLGKYGLYDASKMEQQAGRNTFSLAVEYPLSPIQYAEQTTPYNLLMVVVDELDTRKIAKDMPYFTQIRAQSLDFINHYTTSDSNEFSTFSLFYGLTPNYYNGILLAKQSPVLLNALNYHRYLMSFFSTTGFDSPLYQQALLADFSLPQMLPVSNEMLVQRWQSWLDDAITQPRPWFSFVQLSLYENQRDKQPQSYQKAAVSLDQQIKTIFDTLQQFNLLDNTIVIVTAHHGIQTSGRAANVMGYNHEYNLERLFVPFVMHWPQKPPQKITQRTSHVDVAKTLMKSLFLAKTDPNKYALGTDLLEVNNNRVSSRWVTAGDNEELLILTDKQLIIFDRMNQYKVYDANLLLQPNSALDLSVLLQILTENRRFIIY